MTFDVCFPLISCRVCAPAALANYGACETIWGRDERTWRCKSHLVYLSIYSVHV